MDLLLEEWNLYLEKLNKTTLSITSLHLGGGTPTFLKPRYLDDLLSHFKRHRGQNFVGSIEIDPRICTEEHLDVLEKYHFARISLGIQDFNLKVQTSINRIQSFDLVKRLISQIKRRTFTSLNFDLIYGLPCQTTQSIADTIEKVVELSPDMIAFYSYAHLPSKIKNQKLVPKNFLPTPFLKRELYVHGKDLLKNAGFFEIGLDHFAKKDSYLLKVQREGKLLRNFMGHTDKKTKVLLGLGLSAISHSGSSFMQVHHEIKDYIADLKNSLIPIERGHIHTKDDLLIEEIIQNIMCNQKIDLSMVRALASWKTIEKNLEDMFRDGLLSYSQDQMTIEITEDGRPFLRNISSLFDPNISHKKQTTHFSQTI